MAALISPPTVQMNEQGQKLGLESSQRDSLQRSKQGHKDKSNIDKHHQRAQSTNRGPSREIPHTHFPFTLSRKNKEVFREPAHYFSGILLVSSSSAEICQPWKWIQMPSILVVPHPSPLELPTAFSPYLAFALEVNCALYKSLSVSFKLGSPIGKCLLWAKIYSSMPCLYFGYLWLFLLSTWRGI